MLHLSPARAVALLALPSWMQSCTEVRHTLCRPADPCPAETSHDFHAANPTTDAFDYAGYIGVSYSLSNIDSAVVSDVDPSSLDHQPPIWPDDHIATRTEGCGLVTFEIPFPRWTRHAVYDTSTGLLVGGHSLDDIAPEHESDTCVDRESSTGTWPPPACGTDVTRLCRRAP